MKLPTFQADRQAVEGTHLASRFREASRILALLVVVLGLAVFCGWAFNVPALTYIRPGLQSMKVNTALSFLCLGTGLWLAGTDERRHSRRVLGFLVVIIAGATLTEYAFHVSLGIDQLLFRDTRTPSLSAYPGRMAIATAMCFLLLGVAVIFLGRKNWQVLSHALVHTCFAVSLVALCGYLFGVQSLYAITAFSTVSLHTTVGLMAACVAYFLGRPDEGIVSIAASDTNSGLVLRTLVPAIIVVPILIGWLRLAGQRANLYDTPFGVALLVLSSIGCMTVLTVLIVRSMYLGEQERARVEEALKKSEERRTAIVESSDDAIVGVDTNGTVTDWNKGAERLFGYTAKEAIGGNIAFLSAADLPNDGPDVLKKVLRGEVLRHYETVRQRKDDSRVDISLTVSPIVDFEGRIVGASGIARDITEQKRAEDALKRSDKYSRELVLRSPVAMVVIRGPEHKSQLVNHRFTELFGYTIEDVPDEAHWWPLAYPDEVYRETVRGEWQWRVEGALRQQTDIEPMEATVHCKDGLTRRIEFHFASLGDTGLVSFVDLTDRERAQVKLRESEARFRLVANAAPVMIWMSGPDKLCTYFNQPWLEFTGRSLETELGNGWAEGVHAEDLNRCLETYSKAFDRRQSFEMQYRLRRNDGEYRWILDIGVLRFNADSSFAGYIGSCIDITERKMAEDALADLSGRLIDAQEEERKRIAREIHDDYTQRLAMVAIDLESLAEQVKDCSEAQQQLRQLWNHVSEIGADLHSLSHSLHSSTLENLGPVAGIRAFCEEFSDQQGIEVDFAHKNVPHGIRDDGALCLFRIVQESLRNVKRHSGADRADVCLEGLGEKLHLSVVDRGRGFDVNKESSESGIGIRSMEERLRLLGGHLEVYSRPTEGTRVEAWLPIKNQPT